MLVAFVVGYNDNNGKNANIGNARATTQFFMVFDKAQLIEVTKNPFAISGSACLSREAHRNFCCWRYRH